MTRSFGLDACSALEALKTSVERFKDDDLNEDLARECACKAWHLCDHVFKALGPNSPFATLQELQEHARGVCPELAYLRDICIESKHGEITRHVAHIKVKEARHHTRPPKTIVNPTALGPVANTDTKLLIYGLFQKGRVLAQDALGPDDCKAYGPWPRRKHRH